jgi:hypothetical protein
MGRALTAATAYFLILFTLGFALGIVRVLLLIPRIGEFAATLAEVPVMLSAAYFICGSTIRRWQVARAPSLRWAMVGWFLILLFLFEALLGAMLFGQTVDEMGAALATPAGILGLTAQVIAALLPMIVGRVSQSERSH